MDIEAAKALVCERVDALAPALLAVSHDIHEHPELAFEEHHAHDVLADALDAHGLATTRHAHGVATALRAEAGREGPTIAVLCEYDALPGIGHACGHNIIAAAGLGAGLAAAALADEAGGRVVILGTPAEEGGGGKVALIDDGAFSDVDAAVMVHPAGVDLQAMDVVANQQLVVEFHGQAAHAAAAPWQGANALDAAVLAYQGVAALRQHIRPDERVHGIFTDGGDKPNIVPQHTAMHWYVRSPRLADLEPLRERVLACMRAGAEAAGCTMEHRWLEPVYADMHDNGPLVAAYTANAARLGRRALAPGDGPAVVGSTDMGNVSYVVPSIHPMIAVSPADVAIHTPAFTGYAGGPDGDRAVLDGAKALAMTVIDAWLDPSVLDAAREAFAEIRRPPSGTLYAPAP
ncbi:MAG: M20 family metallopeptidase [Acidimicrobiales bacterium]|nr:M20 family metallopeptidase [Acidimicrobiales bacterium]MCB1259958.1 M20 family metallopeptidase [Acidimicrobiales bacterium]